MIALVILIAKQFLHSDFCKLSRSVLTMKHLRQITEIENPEYSKVLVVSYSNFGEKTLQTNR